jgi:hypothetical protein
MMILGTKIYFFVKKIIQFLKYMTKIYILLIVM